MAKTKKEISDEVLTPEEIIVNLQQRITRLATALDGLIKECETAQKPEPKHATTNWRPLSHHNYALEVATQAVLKEKLIN